MIKYPFKELTYAKEIEKNGFTSNYIKYELKILAKYYRDLGHKPKERKEMLHKFCEENLEGYNKVLHYKLINSVLNYSNNKKNKLIEIESIGITEKEISFIDSSDASHVEKKVLFTLLVLDKLNKKYRETQSSDGVEHYFGGNMNYKLLLSSSEIKESYKNLHNIIGDLAKKGFLETVGRGSIKLSFIYGISSGDEVSVEVNTFYNIGLYYDLHVGEKRIKKCECCDVPIRVKSNRSKYCSECWKVEEKKIKREWKRNHDKSRSLENSQNH
jgi:hypothetical protein